MSSAIAAQLLDQIGESMRVSLEATAVQERELVAWQETQDGGRLRAHSLHEALARLGEHLNGWQTRLERVVDDTRQAEGLLRSEEVELERFSTLLATTRERLTSATEQHHPGDRQPADRPADGAQ